MSEAHTHSSFYRFVTLPEPERVAQRLREISTALGGNILVAPEGISAAIAGPALALADFEQALQQDPAFDGAFQGMWFKHSACTTRPFTLIKVHTKPEIVAFGVPGVSGLREHADPAKPDTHVPPERWRELIHEPDVVVLDNRNSFEFRLGRFANAIDPEVAHFRDFPAYVAEHAEAWKTQGKRIAMYCTGGIRCEKTSAWMQDQGLTVYQLDGGVVNYFETMPDAQRDWEGELFVFDKRIAIDTHLQETPTTAEDVYAGLPDEAWRLARAKRLDPAG
ncbi:oxygen-dependent tRNA uridine(34) hydroxylase TrhO [Roseateles koreensis]|uniref:Rhodanese-like domain-containing protein n=1 Tax=Roseateles koreensis TaxID=2987526 RepID=A0ABT5KRL3_9BURK|nr:rhodanese-like domain-containing protein [Roseateles koreensis]MDC8785559.1 rhodanese-like domain-containing protein [Roseateles koreensis]